MARGVARRNQLINDAAWQAMSNLKYEIARDIGLSAQTEDKYWGEIPSRDCGAVGGHMVRRMIRFAEDQLAKGATLPKG